MNIQKQKQVGDIVRFKAASFVVDVGAAAVAVVADKNNFLYNKRLNIWNDRNILKDQIGIILETRTVENTIKPEYQKYYQGKYYQGNDWIPYLWYCFRTAKVYLIFQCELE